MRATVVNQPGAPEVLTATEIDRPELGPGQVLVEVAVSGVNFLDVVRTFWSARWYAVELRTTHVRLCGRKGHVSLSPSVSSSR